MVTGSKNESQYSLQNIWKTHRVSQNTLYKHWCVKCMGRITSVCKYYHSLVIDFLITNLFFRELHLVCDTPPQYNRSHMDIAWQVETNEKLYALCSRRHDTIQLITFDGTSFSHSRRIIMWAVVIHPINKFCNKLLWYLRYTFAFECNEHFSHEIDRQ